MQQRVRGPWEATPAGQATSLAMARIRLLVADAYRLGQRGRNDPNRRTAQDVVRDAMADLELALRSIADAARCEDTRAASMLFAGSIRSARLGAPPNESAEYLDGWDAAVRCVAERLFGEESAEVKTLETLPASRAAYHPKGDGRTERS
jgi:hypothetical protein